VIRKIAAYARNVPFIMDRKLLKDCAPLVISKTWFIQKDQLDSKIGNDA
jgi:hypothetical protein